MPFSSKFEGSMNMEEQKNSGINDRKNKAKLETNTHDKSATERGSSFLLETEEIGFGLVVS